MVKEIPVIYIQTAACTGCAVSMLNAASPTIKNVLIDQIVPGVHINLKFHPVVMAAAGDLAIGLDVAEGNGARPGRDGGYRYRHLLFIRRYRRREAEPHPMRFCKRGFESEGDRKAAH